MLDNIFQQTIFWNIFSDRIFSKRQYRIWHFKYERLLAVKYMKNIINMSSAAIGQRVPGYRRNSPAVNRPDLLALRLLSKIVSRRHLFCFSVCVCVFCLFVCLFFFVVFFIIIFTENRLWRQCAWNIKAYSLGKMRRSISNVLSAEITHRVVMGSFGLLPIFLHNT